MDERVVRGDEAALRLALAVVPKPQGALEVRTASLGSVTGRVLGNEDGCLLVAARAGWVCCGDLCVLVVMDERRAGFEVDAVSVEVKDVGDGDELLRFAVRGVRRVKSRRVGARAAVEEHAVVQSHADGLDVQVVDVGAQGFAFFAEQPFEVGEAVSVLLNVERRVVPVTAGVANVGSIGFGRFRVGCRFLEISHVHRAMLEALARTSSAASSDRRVSEPADGFVEPGNSALLRRLGRTDAPPPSGEPTLTALYCRACSRITVHKLSPDEDNAWRCASCEKPESNPGDDSPREGAESRAA